MMKCVEILTIGFLLFVIETESKKIFTICDDNGQRTEEKPGLGRSVRFLSNCEISLTNLQGRISFPGTTSNTPCGTQPSLTIMRTPYCFDEATKDIMIDPEEGEITMSLSSIGSDAITLDYYRGEELISLIK